MGSLIFNFNLLSHMFKGTLNFIGTSYTLASEIFLGAKSAFLYNITFSYLKKFAVS